MDESESNGSSKGNLKDHFRFLNIILKLIKKKKMKIKRTYTNEEKLKDIRRFYLFFYTPVKIVLENSLKLENMILYNKSSTLKTTLMKSSVTDTVDLELIRRKKKKKGIDIAEEVKKEEELKKKTEEEQKQKEDEKLKHEISEKYNVSLESVTPYLIEDYLKIMNNSEELFDMDLPVELKDALMIERIKSGKEIDELKKVAQIERDTILEKEIDYDLKGDNKDFEKLEKLLEKQKEEIEYISSRISRYDVKLSKKTNITNLGTLVSNSIGIGLGLLTLPFSFSRTFALGTNLVRKSLGNIRNKVKIESKLSRTVDYQISYEDIETSEKALKTSDFLLEDILYKLDHLKYKIKLYEYKLPDASKKIAEIEALEMGLAKKKRELTKLVESFEKSKTKVLNRDQRKEKI